MNKRLFWLEKIESAWKQKNVVWLQGVRRSGKTTLCQSLGEIELFDCELPRVRRLFEDPEVFFKNAETKRIAIDEIHLLPNPAEVLKIGADYFKNLKIIATGSSTLHARKKFSDTLSDRKRIVHLTPMNSFDFELFETHLSWKNRLLRGGLPGFVLNEVFEEENYKDWLNSYLAKDIEELYSIDNKSAFKKMMEILALQSGGLFEASKFAQPCGISAPTVQKYLEVMEQTHIVYVLRPYFKNPEKEVIRAAKTYFFDTGFISYYQGWDSLREKEKGDFFENICVNEVHSVFDSESIHYWRDKNQNEIDLIIKRRGKSPVAIECKWQAKEFSPRAMKIFREIHGSGINFCVVNDLDRILIKNFGDLQVEFVPYSKFLTRLMAE